MTYELTRDFSAPVRLVWRALTEPELVSRWYGPGVDTVIHEFDLRVGGAWLTEMRMDRGSMFQRADFLAVEDGQGFTCVQANTDEAWNAMDNPMMAGWPKLLTLSIKLTAIDTGTRLDLTWDPHEATEEEIAGFAAMIGQMGGGWSAGMDILEQMLAELNG